MLLSKVQRQIEVARSKSNHNAFIYINEHGSLEHARNLDNSQQRNEKIREMNCRTQKGSLHGMTLAIKDNIEVGGLPMTGGHGTCCVVPDNDCTVISHLREAGAIFIGKTNLHELAFGTTSDNARYGAVGCALDVNLFAGGSSGGTAVAVALGMCDAGLGTDTGGSIRIPSSMNGIVGFKPTKGRYKTDGLVPISYTRDVVGPMTKDVRTAAVLDSVMSGEEVSELEARTRCSIRLGVPTSHFWEGLEEYVDNVTSKAKQKLEDAGVTVIPVDMSDIITEFTALGRLPIAMSEYKVMLPAILKQLNFVGTVEEFVDEIASPDVRRIVKGVIEKGLGAEDPKYQEAMAVSRPNMQHKYYEIFTKHRLDGLLFPSTKISAQPKSGHDPLQYDLKGYIENTEYASFTGLPSLVIPAGPGARVGVQIDGGFKKDRELLAVGVVVEEILLAAL